MKTAVIAPSAISMIQKTVEASRNASRFALLEELGEHRDERGRERGVGEEVGDEVGNLEGERERRVGPARAEEARREHLAREPGDPREPRRDGEDGGVARDVTVLGRGRRARRGGSKRSRPL